MRLGNIPFHLIGHRFLICQCYPHLREQQERDTAQTIAGAVTQGDHVHLVLYPKYTHHGTLSLSLSLSLSPTYFLTHIYIPINNINANVLRRRMRKP